MSRNSSLEKHYEFPQATGAPNRSARCEHFGAGLVLLGRI